MANSLADNHRIRYAATALESVADAKRRFLVALPQESISDAERRVEGYTNIQSMADGRRLDYGALATESVSDADYDYSGTFSPDSIAGLTLWMDATDITSLWQDVARTTPVTADGENVRAWDDVTNVRSFTATFPVPTYETNIQNGKPIIRFPITSLIQTVGAAINLTNFSIFIVAKRAAVGDFALLGSNTNNFQWRLGQGGVNALSTFDGASNPQSTTLNTDTAAAFTVLEFLRSSTTVSFFQDGVAESSGAMSGSALVDRIGAFPSGNSFNGDYGEILIYDSSLSGPNRILVEGYLKTKWGTP